MMLEKKSQIGLTWSPKIPSLANEANINLMEANVLHEDNIWKPGSQQLVDGLFVPPLDPRKMKKLLQKGKKDTAGSSWFNMPAPTVTPEVEKDLEILKLRSVMDPKRHYKKGGANSKAPPKYFQIGTIVESSSDYYSSRLTRKERKASIAEELLSDPNANAYRKRKVREIQAAKRPGGKQKWKKKGSDRRKRGGSKKAIL